MVGLKLLAVMVKCAIWLSAALISVNPHHSIHLVVVQPPGVKIGWSDHAGLQQHILTSLTLAYVGYTVMFQQSPSLLYSSSISQFSSFHLPPSHPNCLRMVFGSGTLLECRQFLFICVIFSKPGRSILSSC